MLQSLFALLLIVQAAAVEGAPSPADLEATQIAAEIALEDAPACEAELRVAGAIGARCEAYLRAALDAREGEARAIHWIASAEDDAEARTRAERAGPALRAARALDEPHRRIMMRIGYLAGDR